MTKTSFPARRGAWSAAALAMVPALALSACATPIPTVDVTRFHSGEVARAGTVALVPRNPGEAQSLEYRSTASAVAAALRRTGFNVLDAGATGADFTAVISLRREVFQPGDRRSPVAVGVGGSTGSYGSGVGVGLSIDLSGKPKPVVATQLRVQLTRTRGGEAIWEGRAETAAKEGSPAAQPGLAAGKLADALFQNYPGPSGQTVTVK